MQEYVAHTAYSALADRVGEPAAADVLHQIARQEARHLRFYRRGAVAVLAESDVTRRVVRLLIDIDWKPPGVSLFGTAGWAEIFRPLLADRELERRLLRMDQMTAALPGLAGLQVMERFLARCRAVTPRRDPLSGGEPAFQGVSHGDRGIE
jgi:hypothetical protein